MNNVLKGSALVCLCLTAGIAQAKVTADLGPRPMYLVDNMDESPLKAKLQACEAGHFTEVIFRLVIAVPRCSFLNTQKSLIWLQFAQVLGYSNVT
ncbi:hypothetical protein TUMSATVNIG1_47120 [Vibrio nigripulchritudo]|nr:hypothetical protein TUMSATVNIG1_47120 [Vibrio nigripulchritudo]